jgi:uncharacterized protein
MRVVLDANQYATAELKPFSKPAQVVLVAMEERVVLLASEPNLEEIERVLSYPRLKKLHQFTQQEFGQYIEDIQEAATMPPGKLKIKAVKADRMDDKYLVCAVEGRADFIVSGDQHLKDLNVFLGIRIVDPVTFLQMLE